jgi:RNA-directed DNA polymerase
VTRYRDLLKAASISIVRHVKIRAEVNPYDPQWEEYITYRKAKMKNKPAEEDLLE